MIDQKNDLINRAHWDRASSTAPPAREPPSPPSQDPNPKNPKQQRISPPQKKLSMSDFKILPAGVKEGSVGADTREAKARYERDNPTRCFWAVHGIEGCRIAKFGKCQRCKAS
jgi:hypothetical protein